MPVKLRLMPIGSQHNRVWKIVAASARNRDARPIETIGQYIPRPVPLGQPRPIEELLDEHGRRPKQYHQREVFQRLEIDYDRARLWLGRGAEMTNRVRWLFAAAGLLPAFPFMEQRRVPYEDKEGALKLMKEWEAEQERLKPAGEASEQATNEAQK
eukprot:TRINITY_DN874_c0_g1_i1.p1 TRINITY_DN874_c0_g1~~TRINITY_DN874_c0_g1_i1.p1  ORF type:complete len:156 (-),score=18.05 TRINITY_DN874_c0_g1_i1:10-477(-)